MQSHLKESSRLLYIQLEFNYYALDTECSLQISKIQGYGSLATSSSKKFTQEILSVDQEAPEEQKERLGHNIAIEICK